MKQIIDFEKELKELVKFERNKQLNQFSLLYYKKLNKILKLMNSKFIIIVLGEPYSTFSEILGKYFTKLKNLKKIILVGNTELLKKQLVKWILLFK